MKLLTSVAVCAVAVTAEFNFNVNPKDASDMVPQLGMMMQAAQMKLSHAQRHHAKVVDKIRKQVETEFQVQSSEFGHDLAKYSADLKHATDELDGAINASKAELSYEDSLPHKADDWDSPGMQQRARLSAEVSAADRQNKHAARRNERAVQELADNVGEVYEDEASTLSMKLGDLTEVSDAAKKNLKDHMSFDKVSEPKIPSAPKFTGKDEQTRLEQASKYLQSAEAKSKTHAQVAVQSSGFLAKAQSEVEATGKKVLDELAVAQKKEIDKVLGRTTPKPSTSHPAAKVTNAKVLKQEVANKKDIRSKSPVTSAARHSKASLQAPSAAVMRAASHKNRMKKFHQQQEQQKNYNHKTTAAPSPKHSAPRKVHVTKTSKHQAAETARAAAHTRAVKKQEEK